MAKAINKNLAIDTDIEIPKIYASEYDETGRPTKLEIALPSGMGYVGAPAMAVPALRMAKGELPSRELQEITERREALEAELTPEAREIYEAKMAEGEEVPVRPFEIAPTGEFPSIEEFQEGFLKPKMRENFGFDDPVLFNPTRETMRIYTEMEPKLWDQVLGGVAPYKNFDMLTSQQRRDWENASKQFQQMIYTNEAQKQRAGQQLWERMVGRFETKKREHEVRRKELEKSMVEEPRLKPGQIATEQQRLRSLVMNILGASSMFGLQPKAQAMSMSAIPRARELFDQGASIDDAASQAVSEALEAYKPKDEEEASKVEEFKDFVRRKKEEWFGKGGKGEIPIAPLPSIPEQLKGKKAGRYKIGNVIVHWDGSKVVRTE